MPVMLSQDCFKGVQVSGSRLREEGSGESLIMHLQEILSRPLPDLLFTQKSGSKQFFQQEYPKTPKLQDLLDQCKTKFDAHSSLRVKCIEEMIEIEHGTNFE